MKSVRVSRERKTYHHGNLRSQLVSAIRSLVERNGPDGFSVSEACRQAGVSTAAPYRHFSDRQEILNAVCLQAMDELQAAFRDATAPYPAGSHDAVCALCEAYVSYARENPGVFRMMFAAGSPCEALREAGAACRQEMRDQIAGWMNESDRDDVRVRRASFSLWTFVHGLAFMSIEGRSPAEARWDGTAELISDAVARLLPPAPEEAAHGTAASSATARA
jgi:AcrR family transcriptional regulator